MHKWGKDELTMKPGPQTIMISTLPTSILGDSRPGQLHVAKPKEMWNKLKATGIIAVAIVDLN